MARHSERSMRVLYEKWQSSSLSKKSLAIKQGVSPSTFYYWVAKFEKQRSTSVKARKGFERLELDGARASAVTATIRYPSGVVIEWHGNAETVHLLKTLL